MCMDDHLMIVCRVTMKNVFIRVKTALKKLLCFCEEFVFLCRVCVSV